MPAYMLANYRYHINSNPGRNSDHYYSIKQMSIKSAPYLQQQQKIGALKLVILLTKYNADLPQKVYKSTFSALIYSTVDISVN